MQIEAFLRYNVLKANGVAKDSGSNEKNSFKNSRLGQIIGNGLELDAFTFFKTTLHPTEAKKNKRKRH